VSADLNKVKRFVRELPVPYRPLERVNANQPKSKSMDRTVKRTSKDGSQSTHQKNRRL
jgi:hypothetical protein